ncbi:DUF2786 domain-containing protein [Streptomyces sp. TRM66268-LWL]|uniref:DUF2786 domain-containing protein n=1 Tax=Streptomyces polyasparticus TaxID=2767826 RepID=A0ABR7SQV6_9ACTN|nr:DUF2786 domain-containing protein [Streptomyces polyasparticus]MBC9717885.1 DUF2786 domain-containing protein [Streptomyces polyasparticus]
MSDAVTRAFEAALYTDDDAALDTGAALLAADLASVGEAGRRGTEFVTRAWQRGWQPADVVRMVRRELTEEHAQLAAGLILDETGRYTGGLPARWDDQLAALPARGEPADRFLHATALLELYRLLLRLPAIEPVGPAPGTPAHTAPVSGGHEPRMLTRIRALLAKAEATDFPDEAEALTAKAQELMARHSIDEALLAHREHSAEAPRACRIGVDAPYETAKAILLDAVATANRCRAVWNESFGFSTVVGFAPDLEMAEVLYTSLLVQGTAAMTRAEAAQRSGGRRRTKTFRQSFLMAYAHRVGERLAAASDHVAAEDYSLLPVLAAREVAVTGAVDEMFPSTQRTRVRGVDDAAGWEHGRAAADEATQPLPGVPPTPLRQWGSLSRSDRRSDAGSGA